MKKSNHLNNKGEAQMVDIAEKAVTKRKAIASGIITVSRKTIDSIKQNINKKGEYYLLQKLLEYKQQKELQNSSH